MGATWRSVAKFALWITGPILLLALAAIFLVDSEVAIYCKSQFGSPLHLWARDATDVAKAGPYFAVTGGLFVLFAVLRRLRREAFWLRAEQWALFGFLSFLTSGILVQGLKHLIGRKRPYADETMSSHEFVPLTSNYEFHSLPSGHSQVLFTAAAVLTALVPRAWLAWIALAVVFSSTRVLTLNHWTSDVLAGAAVGLFGTVLTVRLLQMLKDRKLATSASVAVLAMTLATSLTPNLAHAETPGPFGFGIVLGDPTGLSMNYDLSRERSIDAGLAWSFGGDPGFEVHSDYLWHRDSVLRADKLIFDLHYGIGARLLSLSDRHGTDRTRFGPRLPIGLSSSFNQRAIEIFAEIALVMNVIPATTADFDFGIGARVYF